MKTDWMITAHARKVLGGIFDPAGKKERLEEVEGLLANPDVWGDQEKYQQLSKEKLTLESCTQTFANLEGFFDDSEVLLEMVKSEQDEDAYNELLAVLDNVDRVLARAALVFAKRYRPWKRSSQAGK